MLSLIALLLSTPAWQEQIDPKTFRAPVIERIEPTERDYRGPSTARGIRLDDQWVEMVNTRVVRFGITVTALHERKGTLDVRCVVLTNTGWVAVRWKAFDDEHVMKMGDQDSNVLDVTIEGARANGHCIVE